MAEQVTPYVEGKAGGLISAAVWNQMQIMIKEDISAKVQEAIASIQMVDQAADAEKLSGKTLEQVGKEIVERVLSEVRQKSAYKMLFRVLKKGGEENVVKHDLHTMPLTDVYQLDYFRVVASEDGHVYETFTTFYLYHDSESKIRYRPETGDVAPWSVEVDPANGTAYRIPFKKMLELYGVEWDDNSSVGDLESDFWDKFFSGLNDRFDDDQFCHSPWWDRCCREERTVRSLRDDWDNLYFQVRPIKTINYTPATGDTDHPMAPNQVEVMHFDMDTLGLRLIGDPVLPVSQVNPPKEQKHPDIEAVNKDHMKVMLLLKV